MATPETWSEKGKVSIMIEGGTSNIEFETITETSDIDIGDKDIDVIATLKGGRLVKYTPQDVTTITFEAYPIEAGTATGTSGKGFFDLLNTVDSAQPLIVPVDFARNRYRVALLWTNDPTNLVAYGAVATPYLAQRVIACGFFISAKPSFTDGVLKWTVQHKSPPFKKEATANVQIESTDGTAILTALDNFSTTVNFRT